MIGDLRPVENDRGRRDRQNKTLETKWNDIKVDRYKPKCGTEQFQTRFKKICIYFFSKCENNGLY